MQWQNEEEEGFQVYPQTSERIEINENKIKIVSEMLDSDEANEKGVSKENEQVRKLKGLLEYM